MPQKTAVENNRVGQNRFGIAQVVARDRPYRRMTGDEVGQANVIHNRNIIGSVNCRKIIPKLAFENRRDGAATILEDVVVKD